MEEQKISFLESGKIRLEGLPDFYVHFVEDFHLQDRSIWKKFVNVFKMKTDTADNGWRGEFWGSENALMDRFNHFFRKHFLSPLCY